MDPAGPAESDAWDLTRAVRSTVHYSDLFDYPLRPREIHRYLHGVQAAPDEVRRTLWRDRCLSTTDGFVTLAGRGGLTSLRRRREQYAQFLWAKASRFAALLSRIPFVRMIAVTGSLAVNNAAPNADADLLVVTAPGRLWIARAMFIHLIRRLPGGRLLCPNFFLTTDALAQAEQDVFTAREITQMVPLTGLDVYEEFRRQNRWTDRFLPNAQGLPVSPLLLSKERPRPGSALETLLPRPLMGWIEAWEARRKKKRFEARPHAPGEAVFSPTRCKRHFAGRRLRVLSALSARGIRVSAPGFLNGRWNGS